jgi:hypothetical protein
MELRRGGLSGLDEASADRVTHQTRRFMDVELAHQPRSMGLGGLRADSQNFCNVLGRVAFDHLKNLSFSWRERIRRQVRLGEIRLDHCAGDIRAQISSTAHQLLHCLDEIRRRLILQDISFDAHAKRLGHVLSLVVAREQDHLRCRRALFQIARRIQAVQKQHAVEDRNVWAEGRYEADDFLTVGCLAGYLKSSLSSSACRA